jgi:hypothetical protein
MQSYTSKISCQAENTLTFALILRAFHAIAVDNSVEKVWTKMWINRQHYPCQKLNVFELY